MIKKFIFLLLVFLTACSGGEDAVATSVALTLEAQPTNTPEPTDTPAPTDTPEPTATPTPEPLSEAFLNQVTNFLEEGSSLTGATTTGVSYVEFGRLLGRARGAYDLALDTWPANVSREPIEDFDQAFIGWSLVNDLWELKIGDYDEPVEPDLNGYLEYLDYAGDDLLLVPHPDDFIVPEYRGMLHLPFDENISILMSIAADHFEEGRRKTLMLIE